MGRLLAALAGIVIATVTVAIIATPQEKARRRIDEGSSTLEVIGRIGLISNLVPLAIFVVILALS